MNLVDIETFVSCSFSNFLLIPQHIAYILSLEKAVCLRGFREKFHPWTYPDSIGNLIGFETLVHSHIFAHSLTIYSVYFTPREGCWS